MERKPKIQVPRCIMFVIYNQPWEVDVPRLRLQMRARVLAALLTQSVCHSYGRAEP